MISYNFSKKNSKFVERKKKAKLYLRNDFIIVLKTFIK